MRSPNHLEIKKRCQESIASLMAKHKLGSLQKVVVDEAGWVNPCVFVNDALVFRFNARDPNLPKYHREKIAFDRLQATDVPVPRKAVLDDSKTDAPYDVLITERLSGRNLETDWSTLQPTQKTDLAKRAGQLLTQITSIEFSFFGELSGRGPLPQTTNWFDYLEAKLSLHLQEAGDLGIFDDSSMELFLAALQKHKPYMKDVTSAKLVHVDYHFGNLLYEAHTITGVFDFEWAFAGDPLYDYCRWVQDKEEWPGSRHSFLQGCGRDGFSASEMGRMALYQMIKNIELSVVAKLHFSEEEARSFRETTLVQAKKL